MRVLVSLPIGPVGLLLTLLVLVGSLQADSAGTGFFVSQDGYLVTNFHVIEGANRIEARVDGRSYPCRVVRSDAANDLALLKVEGGIAFSHLPLAGSDPIAPGEEVFTVGFPDPGVMGVTPKTTRGSVSALAGIRDDPRFLQMSVPIQPGNSGGPLVDLWGRIVGVTTMKLSEMDRLKAAGYLPQNVNYSVKTAYLDGLLHGAGVKVGKRDRPSEQPPPFRAVQQDVEKAVALIIASGGQLAGTPPTPGNVPPQPPPAPRTSSGEKLDFETYTGHVGRLDAVFRLHWYEDGRVVGSYYYPKRGRQQTYSLVGRNPSAGKLILTEYEGENTRTANLVLQKRLTESEVIWEGRMFNTDGRTFDMQMRRSR